MPPLCRGIQVPKVHSTRVYVCVIHSTSIVFQKSSTSGDTDVQTFQRGLMHVSEDTDTNGVRMAPHRQRNYPSQTEQRPQQL